MILIGVIGRELRPPTGAADLSRSVEKKLKGFNSMASLERLHLGRRLGRIKLPGIIDKNATTI